MLLGLAFGGAAFGRQLVQPAVNLGNDFDKLARGFVRAARRRLHWRGVGVPPRNRFELTREIVEAAIDAGQALVAGLAGKVIEAVFGLGPRLVLFQLSGQAVERAAGVSALRRCLSRRYVIGVRFGPRQPAHRVQVFVVFEKMRLDVIQRPVRRVQCGAGAFRRTLRRFLRALRLLRRNRVVSGCVPDDGIEPFANGHSGPARGFARGLARLPPDASHLPSNARFHARIQMPHRTSDSRTFPL